jgi:hypothetical protein
MARLRSSREIVVWSEVLPVLDRKIEAALSDAADAPDMRSMGFAQGQLAAYREMKNLPAALLTSDEMQAAQDADREAIRQSQDPRTWKHPDLIRR